MTSLCEILMQFSIVGQVTDCQRYGNGHINDTYLVVTDTSKKYIFQRINHIVFQNVDMLMHNQELVISYIGDKLKESGEFDQRLVMNLIYTKDNNGYLYYKENYYRCYDFIGGGECLEKIRKPSEFELSGIAFGRFQRLLNGFDANNLFEVIPNFHNTQARLYQLQKAIENDYSNKVNSCKDIIDEYLQRGGYASQIVNLMEKGDIPIRVTHNDTKLNNVLIDIESSQPLAVFDLDTVMPGSIIYDFGDSIRFGANTGSEDERDLEKVNFSMDLYKAFTKGFMSQVKNILNQAEIENLAFGAILLTYECGMRFLADHLNGDRYFRINRENQNLDRAKTQLKMVCDMEKQIKEMDLYIRSFYA